MELAYRCGAISGKPMVPAPVQPFTTAKSAARVPCAGLFRCCGGPTEPQMREDPLRMSSAVRHVYTCGGRQPASAARHHPTCMEGASHHPH